MSINAIQFEEISPETLPFMQSLLLERNGTLATYTEWKYGKNSPQGFRGVVALQEKRPVGCFGVIPKILQMGGEKIPCGWFADWYVAPSMRGSGLGTRLLDEITKYEYKLLFGHPGTKQAHELCLKHGWKPIIFQSARKYILSPASYFKRRTHYTVKRIFLQLRYQIQVFQAKRTNKQMEALPLQDIPRFINPDTNWLFQQPARTDVKRTFHVWEGSQSMIKYCDDRLLSGETRRRVLCIEGMEKLPEDISTFLNHTQAAHVGYVDVFTTNRWLDNLLKRAGFVALPEKPVMWKSSHQHIQEIHVQGIDRENWLYLADS